MNDWNLENFAKFWVNIEHEEAMRSKQMIYYSNPCDCGSSTCDECNPGWDEWNWEDEEPYIQEDYGGY